MTDISETTTCPFDFSEGLEFDPSLADLMSRGPVSRIRLPYGDADAWLVTGFEGVRQVTTDHRLSRAAIIDRDYPRLTPEPIVSPESINVLDPPRSSRLRQLASQAFTKRHVDRMRPAVEGIVGTLLDAMEEHGPPADLAAHLSLPLPEQTICELLGIPPADQHRMQRYAHQMLSMAPDTREAAAVAKAELREYFGELVVERRRDPGGDLISLLAAAEHEDDTLDDQDLAVMALTLMLSGHDTATCQISDIAYLLLTRPELMAHLRSRPETLTQVLDELLRYIPFRKGVGIPRVATENVEICGVKIRAGDFVHVSYLTANRDPERFADPDTIDLNRPPTPHMTFGWGGHRCIAAPLAMAELEAAIGGLLARFPGLRLAVPAEELRWDTETIRRFPCELPVAW
ncbi:cytochrome P450 [Streptomyces sp. AK02-01A]|uniref:cytochrome P450 n=1 Tax=Streptomyces sp. AK02-01A TaxID=3028648 RepID=UPI0029BF173D|nr:cytochrome P450 [Streptomyces sp. AK02-01A]MDX3851795.1 cytochrome P450 [Streptomyces sp. AK02-01A]